MGRLRIRWSGRFRPRLLTLVLLVAIAATIVLANLTEEFDDRGRDVLAGPGQVQFSLRGLRDYPTGAALNLWSLSYGWPLVWRQYILSGFWSFPSQVLGECYSPSRFGLNLAMWLVLLAVPGVACEWLLRRRWRRFQWSLRTMLAAIGLAAVLCGWFAAARNRADRQDAVIATGSKVWVKRWGPRWLDLIGADRYRRAIVGADLDLTVDFIRDDITGEIKMDDADFERKNELLGRVARLRGLRYLFIEIDDHSPDLAKALRSMRQLRVLSINNYGGSLSSPEFRMLSHHCLTAIGALSDLEHLSLTGLPIAKGLDCLAGLTKLQSLCLQAVPS